MRRYQERGSPEGFLSLMNEKWDDFLASCQQSRADLHIKLGPNRYLSDILAELG